MISTDQGPLNGISLLYSKSASEASKKSVSVLAFTTEGVNTLVFPPTATFLVAAESELVRRQMSDGER